MNGEHNRSRQKQIGQNWSNFVLICYKIENTGNPWHANPLPDTTSKNVWTGPQAERPKMSSYDW